MIQKVFGSCWIRPPASHRDRRFIRRQVDLQTRSRGLCRLGKLLQTILYNTQRCLPTILSSLSLQRQRQNNLTESQSSLGFELQVAITIKLKQSQKTRSPRTFIGRKYHHTPLVERCYWGVRQPQKTQLQRYSCMVQFRVHQDRCTGLVSTWSKISQIPSRRWTINNLVYCFISKLALSCWYLCIFYHRQPRRVVCGVHLKIDKGENIYNSTKTIFNSRNKSCLLLLIGSCLINFRLILHRSLTQSLDSVAAYMYMSR